MKNIKSQIICYFLLLYNAYLNYGYLETTLSQDDCLGKIDQFLNHKLNHLSFPLTSSNTTTYNTDDFIFFLHIPRTAGRSFWSCFLQKSFPCSKRCAKSYDILRLDVSVPSCKIIASHDDFSISDFLPNHFKIITQARDPVDRVISAYEFAVQVAARDFSPNITRIKVDQEKVKTRDVWPWLYLVQLFESDMDKSLIEIRREFEIKAEKNLSETENEGKWIETYSKKGNMIYLNTKTNKTKFELNEEEKHNLLPKLDPYDNILYTSLEDFVDRPETIDLLQNALTYQLLGLTNISYWDEAKDIRRCSMKSEEARSKLIEAAKKQLDRMLHVSLTKDLDESLISLAADLNLKLSENGWKVGQNVLSYDKQNYEHFHLSIEEGLHVMQNLSDTDLIKLLFKGMDELNSDRDLTRSRKRTKLTNTAFPTLWSDSLSKMEIVRKIKAEVLLRKKEKGLVPDMLKMAKNMTDEKTSIKLWISYQNCTNATRERDRKSRLSAMNFVRLPDRRKVHFTKDCRKQVKKEVIEKIRKLNDMDTIIFKYAEEIYNKHINEQKTRGILEDVSHLKLEKIKLPKKIEKKDNVHLAKSSDNELKMDSGDVTSFFVLGLGSIILMYALFISD